MFIKTSLFNAAFVYSTKITGQGVTVAHKHWVRDVQTNDIGGHRVSDGKGLFVNKMHIGQTMLQICVLRKRLILA